MVPAGLTLRTPHYAYTVYSCVCTNMKAHSHYAPAQPSGIRFIMEAQVLNLRN